MDLSTEKQRPQLVEVVNQGTSENPTKAEVTNLPLSPAGSVQVSGNITTAFVRPTNSSSFYVCLDNILLLQGDGTFVAIPLNSSYTNIAQAGINNMLASYKSVYATLVAGVTAATLHYSKMSSTGMITSEVYNLKD